MKKKLEPVIIRKESEINEEYSKLCQTLGEQLLKTLTLAMQGTARVAELNMEMSAAIKLGGDK